MTKAKNKRTKKYNPLKNHDEHIPFLERAASPIVRYINEFIAALQHDKITVSDIINHVLMMHRFTFMQDLEYTEIRWLAENLFIEVDNLLKKDNELSKNYLININNDNKQLILLFLDELKSKLFAITNRTLYASLFKEMIIDHNIYCYDKPFIKKWLNKKEVAESLLCCRRRIEKPNIMKALKQNKIPYINDGNDIDYMEVV